MKYILEVADNKSAFADEFFKSISFVKNFKTFDSNEITNQSILQSINDYESKKTKPTILNIDDLKQCINA